jgi:hypothetical protein
MSNRQSRLNLFHKETDPSSIDQEKITSNINRLTIIPQRKCSQIAQKKIDLLILYQIQMHNQENRYVQQLWKYIRYQQSWNDRNEENF